MVTLTKKPERNSVMLWLKLGRSELSFLYISVIAYCNKIVERVVSHISLHHMLEMSTSSTNQSICHQLHIQIQRTA